MNTQKLSLRVANLDCEHEAAAIERGLKDFDGVTELKIYPKSAKVEIGFDPGKTGTETLKEKLESLGFPPVTGHALPAPPSLTAPCRAVPYQARPCLPYQTGPCPATPCHAIPRLACPAVSATLWKSGWPRTGPSPCRRCSCYRAVPHRCPPGVLPGTSGWICPRD